VSKQLTDDGSDCVSKQLTDDGSDCVSKQLTDNGSNWVSYYFTDPCAYTFTQTLRLARRWLRTDPRDHGWIRGQ
jgi:hypothetical protein